MCVAGAPASPKLLVRDRRYDENMTRRVRFSFATLER
jgi:hypothetical protein